MTINVKLMFLVTWVTSQKRGRLYNSANIPIVATYARALPNVHITRALRGKQTATYLSTVTHIVRYTLPVWAIMPTGYTTGVM